MAGAALTCLSAAPSHAETIRITADKLAFSPARILARVGDTVEWANADFVAHTATARNLDWDVTILPGKTSQVVIRKAGSLDYYCRFHPNMTGHVDVR
jgi:plastocyanin